jgi:putative ATP-dependent endonuclease of OLD family
MARIRKVEIKNFRGIQEFTWVPSPGINCLIGPGDSAKSTVLNAIDLCLGARRSVQFTDADFYRLDVESPVSISVTIGELDDALKNIDAYGMYVRGFDPESGEIEDEPKNDAETVLTMRLSVASDLEPNWSLISDRAETLGQERNLSWGDRVRLAPTRIGVMAEYHLGWGRGSVLNRVSEERADASGALARAARDARAAFGDEMQEQLGETLQIVATTAKELGIPVGESVKALLDAGSVSFSGGTISLHDEDSVPLRGLGAGSTRLLVAGLQRKAATQSAMILIDELEHGLEPHRIIRLLGSVGAKVENSPLQVFMTTHSPVVLRELSAEQLFVVRCEMDRHVIRQVGTADDIQGTIRLYPEAFLARSVLVGEGASEVGLVRGFDQHRTANGATSINAQGVALVDCGGGDVDRLYRRAVAFQTLGYRTAILRDDDRAPTEAVEQAFLDGGGKVVAWRDGRAVEGELFVSVSDRAVNELIQRAIDLHGRELVDSHIKSASRNTSGLNAILEEIRLGTLTEESRRVLGKASGTRPAGSNPSHG